MKNKIICVVFTVLLIGTCVYSGFTGGLRSRDAAAAYGTDSAENASAPDFAKDILAASPAPPADEKTQPQVEAAANKSEKSSWTLSFAGDCTIGTLHEWQHSGTSNNMLSVIGSDYAYPLKNVVSYFESDDLTLINLEGTFTESTEAKSKDYRFRASPVYAQVLSEGSVEVAGIANNHTGDYFDAGLSDTKETLDENGIKWASSDTPLIYELEGGLKLGIVAYNVVEIDLAVGDVDGYIERITPLYEDCWKAGCDMTIAFMHWGWEYTTAPEGWMVELAHRLADMGFSMVIGSHAHVLQEMEYYHGVPIFYSLGNFCYGGHSDPTDKDSVIVRQEITKTAGGAYCLGELELIPCRISSSEDKNDFCPTPYDKGSEEYDRVIQKLKAEQYLD